jgi:diadenylate cyclase
MEEVLEEAADSIDECSQGQVQERAIMRHADELGRELGIDTITIQACDREEVDFLGEAHYLSRFIWLSRTPEKLPITESSHQHIIGVPAIAKGENFLTLGYFLGVITGKLPLHTPILNLTACERGVINGLEVTIPARRLPWLHDRQIACFDSIDNPHTLLMMISIAMRFSREGREGKSIGTCFILSDPQEVAQFTWQLILNPCAGYPRHIRNIFRTDFLETLRELSALDGAFLVSPDGEVRAAAVFIATQGHAGKMESGRGARHHAACALTSHTQAIAVVLSESSGAITVYQHGQELLAFQ